MRRRPRRCRPPPRASSGSRRPTCCPASPPSTSRPTPRRCSPTSPTSSPTTRCPGATTSSWPRPATRCGALLVSTPAPRRSPGAPTGGPPSTRAPQGLLQGGQAARPEGGLGHPLRQLGGPAGHRRPRRLGDLRPPAARDRDHHGPPGGRAQQHRRARQPARGLRPGADGRRHELPLRAAAVPARRCWRRTASPRPTTSSAATSRPATTAARRSTTSSSRTPPSSPCTRQYNQELYSDHDAITADLSFTDAPGAVPVSFTPGTFTNAPDRRPGPAAGPSST